MIFVTGASGQLGQLVIEHLLDIVPADQVIAGVRDPASVQHLIDRGIEVRTIDYTKPDTLTKAFEGVSRLLLISSSEVGQRAVQHRNVIEAARDANVGFVAYTSILHADTSPLGLAVEHQETEAMLRDSKLPVAVLRNGWYTENYLGSVPTALEHGVFLGSAGEGQIASATRDDYAAAAARVIADGDKHAGKIYELAGDQAYTLAELADEVSRQTGKTVSYQDLPEGEFKDKLLEAGLPEPMAELLANSDNGARQGGLFDDQHQLSQLIGRPTTPMDQALKESLVK